MHFKFLSKYLNKKYFPNICDGHLGKYSMERWKILVENILKMKYMKQTSFHFSNAIMATLGGSSMTQYPSSLLLLKC